MFKKLLKKIRLWWIKKTVVPKVNYALGIELCDWQIDYIWGGCHVVNLSRRSGKTLAHILKLLFNKDKIELRRHKWFKDVDDSWRPMKYNEWFKRELFRVYKQLKDVVKIAEVTYIR